MVRCTRVRSMSYHDVSNGRLVYVKRLRPHGTQCYFIQPTERTKYNSSGGPYCMSSEVEIVPFRAEHGAAFYALNRAWLDEHGLYEPPDEVQLADPYGTIIAVGGAIFIAVRDGEVLGTAAVVPHGEGEV